MAAWTAAARQAMNIGRLSSPKSASLVHRRGMAASAGTLNFKSFTLISSNRKMPISLLICYLQLSIFILVSDLSTA